MISTFSKYVTDPVSNSGGVLIANGRDNSFPGLTRISNGDLLMVYRDDPFYHAGWRGRILERTSSDEGLTWSAARVAYEPGDNLEARDPEIMTLANGDVLMTCFRRWVNSDTGSLYSGFRDVLKRSNGAWSVLAAGVNPTGYADGGFVDYATCIQHGCSGKIVELSNGDLLWPIYTSARAESGVPSEYGVTRSTDGGLTWDAWQNFGSGNETGILIDPDGNLRLWNRPGGSWFSDDNGATWDFLGTRRSGLDWIEVKPSYAYDANGALCVVYRKGTTGNHVVGIAWSDEHGATWRDVSNLDATGQSMYASLLPNADGSIHILYSRTRSSTQGSDGKKPVDICFVTVTDPQA